MFCHFSIEFDRDNDYFAIAGVTKKIKVGLIKRRLYFYDYSICTGLEIYGIPLSTGLPDFNF